MLIELVKYVSIDKLMFEAGFYFIPGALSLEEQCHWIRESLTCFPQPPNRTNHNAIYGPIHELFSAAIERKFLVEEESPSSSPDSEPDCFESKEIVQRWKFLEENSAPLRGNGGKSVSASVLLRKLRWSTLGVQFDWSKVITSYSFYTFQWSSRCSICRDLDRQAVAVCDPNNMFGQLPPDIRLKQIGVIWVFINSVHPSLKYEWTSHNAYLLNSAKLWCVPPA